jgi:hypothetical protein
MEQIKENALPEAGTSEQSEQVKPLYTDLSISARIMQVLIPTLEIMRILGNGDRLITFYANTNAVTVYEMKHDKETGRTEYVHEWVNVYIDNNLFKHDKVVQELDCAIDTMTDLLGSIRKEIEDGKE